MEECIHLKLIKLSDTMWRPFQAFEEGFHFYWCEHCNQIFKAKVAVVHPVENKEHAGGVR